MVMEAPPSPQSVGREFVRQYYTLLNKAPTHLHRFYNHQSSFVHGGLDPPNRETSPVIGQKQIHQKIQQLNFRDCHAKITQVDSQATLGNGVVVQVTGELSNAGQPMRRFTQTFVLAAQSPKKFYVHNDIFRYQDEIISDEECDDGVASEPEEEVPTGQGLPDHQQPLAQPTIPPYYPNPAQLQPALPPVAIHHNQPPPPHVIPSPVPTLNGAVHPDDIPVLQAQLPPPAVSPQEIQQEEPQEVVTEEEPEELDEQQDVEEVNEPKTYANLLKSGSSIPYGLPPTNIPLPQPALVRSGSPTPGGYQNTRPASRGRGGGINQRPLGRQDSARSNRGAPGDDNFEDRRRSQSQNFGDVNQLFLGNLPHAATEEELREIFGEFGAIVDLRVHSKPAKVGGGASGGRAPPNYGFITYETQQGVENCLRAKPIYYSKDDKTSTVLNVEEKKTKDRLPYSGGRPTDTRPPRGGDNPTQRRSTGPPAGGPNRNSTDAPGGLPSRPNAYPNRSGAPRNRGGGPTPYNRR